MELYMDRFHLMNVYITVAEEQGFASAARRLGMSPPAVTRAIAALEQHLGVKLLNRTTRHVRTTEAGHRYLVDARRVLAEVDAVDQAISGINADPRGHLAITAPVMFGRMFVMPIIVDYLERYPATDISALLLDRDVNLLAEGMDLGVRIGELPDSSMRALAVGSVRQVVCASPEYLRRHGKPERPEDLSAHVLVNSSAVSEVPNWIFSSAQGLRNQRIKPRLVVTSNAAAVEAALADFGLTRLLSYQIAPQLAEGRLQIVLEEFEPEPRPIHIVHREGRFASAAVRSFIDFSAARLRSNRLLA
jgi:DNA-binding transcriptional LysR family regulator